MSSTRILIANNSAKWLRNREWIFTFSEFRMQLVNYNCNAAVYLFSINRSQVTSVASEMSCCCEYRIYAHQFSFKISLRKLHTLQLIEIFAEC